MAEFMRAPHIIHFAWLARLCPVIVLVSCCILQGWLQHVDGLRQLCFRTLWTLSLADNQACMTPTHCWPNLEYTLFLCPMQHAGLGVENCELLCKQTTRHTTINTLAVNFRHIHFGSDTDYHETQGTATSTWATCYCLAWCRRTECRMTLSTS